MQLVGCSPLRARGPRPRAAPPAPLSRSLAVVRSFRIHLIDDFLAIFCQMLHEFCPHGLGPPGSPAGDAVLDDESGLGVEREPRSRFELVLELSRVPFGRPQEELEATLA